MAELDKIRSKKAEIEAIASRHGAYNMRVFGSVARGDERPDSDIDLLVDLKQGYTYFDLMDFQQEMQNLLGKKVDVVIAGGLHHLMKHQVLSEAAPI